PRTLASAPRAPPRPRVWQNRRSPSAKVWSAPNTSRPGRRAAIVRAFSRASSAASSPASRAGFCCSIVRSSISAGWTSTGTPASRRRAWRIALFDARTSGSPASPNRNPQADGRARARGKKAHNRRGGLLDRTPRDVDARPIVPRAQLARERDLLGDRLAVDILIPVVMRPEPEQAILSDLYDPLGAGIES